MSNFVYAVNDALSLLRAWLLQSVGIVGELVLVDSGSPADSSQCKIRPVRVKQGRSIQTVENKLIVAINEPLGHIITISQHTFYVETKGFRNIMLQFLKSFGSQYYCPWHIFAKGCTEILVAPSDIYSNLLHILIAFIRLLFLL